MKKQLDRQNIFNLITIFIAISALLFSFWVYHETTRPHTQFEEFQSRLNALDNRIDRVETWLKEQNISTKNYSSYNILLNEAKAYREEAWGQWINYNFSKINDYIELAQNALDQIPTPEALPSIVIPVVGIVVVIIVIIVLLWKTKMIYIE